MIFIKRKKKRKKPSTYSEGRRTIRFSHRRDAFLSIYIFFLLLLRLCPRKTKTLGSRGEHKGSGDDGRRFEYDQHIHGRTAAHAPGIWKPERTTSATGEIGRDITNRGGVTNSREGRVEEGAKFEIDGHRAPREVTALPPRKGE